MILFFQGIDRIVSSVRTQNIPSDSYIYRCDCGVSDTIKDLPALSGISSLFSLHPETYQWEMHCFIRYYRKQLVERILNYLR